MTIIPTIVSAIVSIFLWLYIRHNIKRNLINLFQFSHKWLWAFDILFLYCGFFRFLYRLQNPYIHNRIFYFFINTSYVLLGFLGLFVLIFLLMDLRNLFDRLFHHPHHVHIDHSRREFFKKNLALTGIATSAFISGSGFANSFDPKVKTIRIPLPDEHSGLDGLKIIQLSDVHIGPTLQKDFCAMLADKINALNADLVAITGDLIDGRVDYLKNDLAPLINLKSKFGTFYITGNHEYYWYANEWIEWSKSVGMKALINENVKLSYNNTDFFLAGVNDPASIRLDKFNATDPAKAARGIPANAYKILLAHQPKACYQAAKAGFHTQLSGHTHGGQGFPWNIIVSMVQPYVRGLNNHEGMNVYVHSGTGFWGPPNRFMIDSEIAEIIFTKS